VPALADRRGAPHRDDLLVENVLNGVALAVAGQALGYREGEAQSVFAEAMRRVEEYVVSHAEPLLLCRDLDAARLHRMRVLEVVRRIRVWTDAECDVVMDVLRGVDVERKYEISREVATDVVSRAMRALPHYLRHAEAAAMALNPTAWITANRRAAMAAVERMVSWRNPYLYKHVEHHTVRPE
jgi:hypothetical protein